MYNAVLTSNGIKHIYSWENGVTMAQEYGSDHLRTKAKIPSNFTKNFNYKTKNEQWMPTKQLKITLTMDLQHSNTPQSWIPINQ